MTPRSPLSTFVATDLHQLPFRDGSFDHVVAFWGVKKIRALGLELQEVRRVLKSTGRLLLILEGMPLAERDRSARSRGSGVPEPETLSGEARGKPVSGIRIVATAGRPFRRVDARVAWADLVFELMPVAEPAVPAGRRTPFLGDFRRVEPTSLQFGFDRGTPIDRHYIEAFLLRNAAFIRGHVLEVGDDTYTWRYGGDTVQISDVLHVSADQRPCDDYWRSRSSFRIASRSIRLHHLHPNASFHLRHSYGRGGALPDAQTRRRATGDGAGDLSDQ